VIKNLRESNYIMLGDDPPEAKSIGAVYRAKPVRSTCKGRQVIRGEIYVFVLNYYRT